MAIIRAQRLAMMSKNMTGIKLKMAAPLTFGVERPLSS